MILTKEQERVRQTRICVALWACSYEFYNKNMVSDHTYDEYSKVFQSQLNIDTDRPELDEWFRDNFLPHTGQWIHKHPELERLKYMVYRHFYGWE